MKFEEVTMDKGESGSMKTGELVEELRKRIYGEEPPKTASGIMMQYEDMERLLRDSPVGDSASFITHTEEPTSRHFKQEPIMYTQDGIDRLKELRGYPARCADRDMMDAQAYANQAYRNIADRISRSFMEKMDKKIMESSDDYAPEYFYLYFPAEKDGKVSVLTACVPLFGLKWCYRAQGSFPVGFALYSPKSNEKKPFIQKRGDDIARARLEKGKFVEVNLLPKDKFPYRLTILTAFFAAQRAGKRSTPGWLWGWRRSFFAREAYLESRMGVTGIDKPNRAAAYCIIGPHYDGERNVPLPWNWPKVFVPILIDRNPARFYRFCGVPIACNKMEKDELYEKGKAQTQTEKESI
jgi:hypothetical protein